ncbi:hypothetical protein B0T16DRAFT_422431 [Cercophora newfieldiana]|uniref:Uncharacterized protein n=1 Tax=Cercophora newfieldiana TaxID=92897 RepID=A0AA39XU16_9PEZI|nr:hypothetical protein B0T16DRAFT_422431 [Cercophora newfieldiana]
MAMELPVVLALLGLTALCWGGPTRDGLQQADRLERRQQPDIKRLSINPNPCDDSTFLTPVYVVSNVTASKTFYPIPAEGPSHVNFTVVDVANKYAQTCFWAREYTLSWGREGEGPYESLRVRSDCIPTNDPNVNRFHNLLGPSLENNNTIHLSQNWICNAASGEFPPVYGAQATFPALEFLCPFTGANGTSHECQISSLDSTGLQSIRSTFKGPSDYPSLPANPRATDPEAVPRRQSPFPSKDCSLASLTYPDWTVDGVSFSKENNDLQFLVTSRASESKFRCSTSGQTKTTTAASLNDGLLHAECVLHGVTADPLHTLPTLNATYDAQTSKISLQQEWSCGHDKGEYSTTFVGSGSSILSSTNTTFVKGSLIKPVNLTPGIIPAPPNIDSPDCIPTSNPSWVLERFNYNLTSTPLYFQDGRAVGPTPVETFDLIIRNTANNLTVRCGNRADSINLDYFGYPYPGWDLCDRPEPSTAAAYAPYPILTYVRIDRLNNVFGVNQTWYCAGKDGKPPVRVNAFAIAPNTTAAISCSSGPFSQQCANPAVLAGSDRNAPCLTWQCTNNTPPPTLTGTLLSTSPLPPTALVTTPDVDPVTGTGQSCTALSVARGPLAWVIDNFRFEAQYYWEGNQLNGRWQLSLKPPVWSEVQRWSGRFYPWRADGYGGWPAPLGAELEEKGEGGWIWRSNWVDSFRTRVVSADLVEGGKKGTAYVEMVGVWYCDDRDPDHPLIFNGTWNGFLPIKCDTAKAGFGDERSNTKIICQLQNGQASVYPKVDWYVHDRPISWDTSGQGGWWGPKDLARP